MKKPIVVFLIPAILATSLATAIDFSTFEATCLEIGFKRNTETFGDCVLELASRAKKADAQKAKLQAQEEEQQRLYENQRQREITAQRQQQEQQAYQLRQQQAQLEAQQAQNRADNAAAMLYLLGTAAASYYSPPPRSPVLTCTTIGIITTCQ